MIKRVFVLVLIFLSVVYAQEETKRIIVKFGKHKDFLRFVFISENQNTVRSINVSLTKEGKIKLLFPDSFDFQFEDRILQPEDKIKDLKIRRENSVLTIETSNIKEIKVLRLDSPARLVVDAFFEGTLSEQIQKAFIVIDPGHGGKDTGFKEKELFEKDIVLTISKEVASKLAQRGIKISLTRASDEDISLSRRVKIGNDLNPLIFLSLHLSNGENFIIYRSSSKRKSTKDLSQIYIMEDNFIRVLTKQLQERFQEPVVVEKIPLSILKQMCCPSVLVELPKRTIMNEDSYRSRIVDVITEAIKDYLKLKEKK